MITATRTHEIACGHRVLGHEGKCQHLHGHNYTFEFTVASVDQQQLDTIGRVVDFGVIKSTLCEWLEKNWDHRFLLNAVDPFLGLLDSIDPNGVVAVPFNPTAENMAEHLGVYVGPDLFRDFDVDLIIVRVWETGKCSAEWRKRC